MARISNETSGGSNNRPSFLARMRVVPTLTRFVGAGMEGVGNVLRPTDRVDYPAQGVHPAEAPLHVDEPAVPAIQEEQVDMDLWRRPGNPDMLPPDPSYVEVGGKLFVSPDIDPR